MIPGTKEWNEPLIRLVTKEDDALEILKTRIPANETTDYPTWHFEKTGLFSVRSAYKLAWTMNNVVSSSSSTSMDGERKLWQNIRKADVQPKVKVFACKLAQNRLPTWENKRKRQIEARGTCPICGQVEESGFHATVECTKSKALRDTLRKFWSLPDEKEFVMSGLDWLLVLLESLNSNDKAHVMYLLWRAWFLRNDSIHGVGAAKVYDSALFLVNYENTLLPVRQTSDDTKGKGKMFADRRGEEQIKEKQTCKWECPPEGFAKMNVDVVFLEESGLSSVGIIVRDCRGLVLLAAHKTLHRCNSVVQAEALACLEGLKTAMEWIHMPLILETDNAKVAKALKERTPIRSSWAATTDEARNAMQCFQSVHVHNIKREANRVAHLLANMAMSSRSCMEWRLCAPARILDLLNQECNPCFNH
jgi:ribonuclease HI